ncbi:hypothetical protein SAMN05518668_101362 [Sphingobium sp. YR657]|uniref:HEPN domain-containing protein n=1 Tax=Sphingobium sp. YR657 TaxID=1884366 RepID=UPI00091E6621|nr:HEPN domain-containing protein [Sphingobium sp. YR657]SHL51430.1 hypothetical protein SAMN05518668_101362 [Sphingobium sp. YR657]
MTRFTPVYGEFVDRLGEISLLRSKAAALAQTTRAVRHRAEISALCRGSVVLLSSHIEAYVKELGEHTLDAIYDNGVCRSKISLPFFYHLSRARIENVRSGSQPANIASHMRSFVEHDATMWGSQGGFPTPIVAYDFNGGFSNPSFDKVKAYLGRFGYENFRRDFMRRLGRAAQPTITGLDQIVDTRNSIAHGDPSATKTPAEVKDMITLAKVFCRTVDTLFAEWCSANLCKIRR